MPILCKYVSRQGEYVIILYIYSTCWHMKSVFYKRQHGVWQRLEQGRRAWCDWGRIVSLVGHEARERGGGGGGRCQVDHTMRDRG
jgi:hypothetical protein